MKSRRAHLGWSQVDLAQAIGSSASRICKLEAGEASVSADLKLRALEAMEATLCLTIDASGDPFADPELSPEQKTLLSARILRRRRAEQIAQRSNVDAGDVEHVLHNLTLSPAQRLTQSFRRANLKRISTKRS